MFVLMLAYVSVCDTVWKCGWKLLQRWEILAATISPCTHTHTPTHTLTHTNTRMHCTHTIERKICCHKIRFRHTGRNVYKHTHTHPQEGRQTATAMQNRASPSAVWETHQSLSGGGGLEIPCSVISIVCLFLASLSLSLCLSLLCLSTSFFLSYSTSPSLPHLSHISFPSSFKLKTGLLPWHSPNPYVGKAIQWQWREEMSHITKIMSYW